MVIAEEPKASVIEFTSIGFFISIKTFSKV